MHRTLSFTGERVIPGQVDPNLMLEHLARYRFACQFAPGQQVLDAACGVGYGSHLLAQSARSVYGIDIAREAIESAQQEFHATNLRFLCGDCHSLSFRDGSFDLVVAFETIEHLPRPGNFLLEVRRVLGPRGVLIISTPNRIQSEEVRNTPNPFHHREFDPGEFRSLLENHFTEVRLASQNHSEGMAIVFPSLPKSNKGSLAIETEAFEPLDQSQYLLGICSNVPIGTECPNPFFMTSSLGNALKERDRHVGLLAAEILALKSRIREVEKTLSERDSHLRIAEEETQNLQHRLSEYKEMADKLDNELKVKAGHIDLLQGEISGHRKRLRVLQQELDVKANHITLLQQENALAQAQAKQSIEEAHKWMGQAARVQVILDQLNASTLFRLLNRLPYLKNYLRRIQSPPP